MLKLRWDIFEHRDVVRILGISERELRYWAVLGIVKPELSPAVGKPGIRRRYTFKNLVQAGLVQALLANHISLHAAPRFLGFVNQTWFFVSRPKELYLVMHKGEFLHAYVRERTPKKKESLDWMPDKVTDLGHSPTKSLSTYLDELMDNEERDSIVVIAAHRVRDRLAKQLGKKLQDL